MTQTQNEKSQVRLIIPQDWVSQLDAIARSRFTSRMAVIRSYIRAQLDKDLANLDDQLALVQKNHRTVDEFTAYLDRTVFKE